jgi:hypothetical protein
MPSPFPGMNPFLEEPELWPAVHVELIMALRDAILPHLVPRYFVTIELREYEVSLSDLAPSLKGIGDVSITRERRPEPPSNGASRADAAGRYAHGESPTVLVVDVPRPVPVREHYLEIRRPRSHDLITTIEVLSPTNKQPGKGRRQYEEKRLTIAETRTNLVEIDLIRAGEPLPVLQRGEPLLRALAGDYRVLVLRGGPPRGAALYPVRLHEPLPTVPVPLRPEDPEPQLDLQAILHTAYDRGRYDLAVDYRDEPEPALPPDDARWADALLREQGLR